MLRLVHELYDGGQVRTKLRSEIDSLAGHIQDLLAVAEHRLPVASRFGLLDLDRQGLDVGYPLPHAPRQVHAQFLHQLPLAGDAVQIADQQNAQQELGINRGPTGFAVAVSQSLAHNLKTDVLLDQPQQVGLRNLIFQAEVIKQRFGAVVLPHHDQQAFDDENQTEHG